MRGGGINPQLRQQYLDAEFPLPPSRPFFKEYAFVLSEQLVAQASVELATIAAWPWLTFAALMVFQASMRKAKVQRGHVLRCVLYSADASVAYTVLTMLGVAIVILSALMQHQANVRDYFALWLLILLWVMRMDKLVSAYRKYLQFDHPFLTVLASQIIVVLATGGLLFWGARLGRWIIWGT